MNEPSALLTLELPLPCGCVLKQAVREFNIGEPHLELFLKSASERIAYWVKDRSARHECALVSEDNPSGARPRGPR